MHGTSSSHADLSVQWKRTQQYQSLFSHRLITRIAEGLWLVTCGLQFKCQNQVRQSHVQTCSLHLHHQRALHAGISHGTHNIGKMSCPDVQWINLPYLSGTFHTQHAAEKRFTYIETIFRRRQQAHNHSHQHAHITNRVAAKSEV